MSTEKTAQVLYLMQISHMNAHFFMCLNASLVCGHVHSAVYVICAFIFNLLGISIEICAPSTPMHILALTWPCTASSLASCSDE